MAKWFSIQNRAGTGEIAILDEIGTGGITAAHFRDELKALGAVQQLRVSINSPGGSVFDGLAIHNMLKAHKANVTVTVLGVAASIASVIAMAGRRITMPDNAFMMIHEPSGLVLGGAKEMREFADVLDKIRDAIIGIYASRSKLSREQIAEYMAGEIWFTAADCLECGFADAVTDPVKMAASFDLSRFKNLPTAMLPKAKPPAQPSQAEIEIEKERRIARFYAYLQGEHSLACETFTAAYYRSNGGPEYHRVFREVYDAAQKGERRPEWIPGTPEAEAAAWKRSYEPIRPVTASWDRSIAKITNRTK